MCYAQWRIQDFPEEGALTPKGEHQPIIWPIFPKNCMKMKKFWTRGGREGCAPPLDPPLMQMVHLRLKGILVVSQFFQIAKEAV